MNEEGASHRGPVLVNRLPAEGINSSDEHPLKEFAWLIGASIATVLTVVLFIGWGARWLAPKVPFSTEVVIAERLLDRPQKPADAARSQALQALAERVSAQMALPGDVSAKLSYEESTLVNAYATLGGRIRVHSALLRKLGSEDELAALPAHEIAHVKHRHVAANLSQGLTLGLLLAVVSSDAGAAATQSALNQTAGVAMLGYSRAQEEQADAEAVRAVVALYGHAGGMIDLFTHLGQVEPDAAGQVQVLSTHPLTSQRLASVRAQAEQAGWALSGTPTPLPAALVLTDNTRSP